MNADIDLIHTARSALDALLDCRPLTVTRDADAPRAGFPLPIKREAPDASGRVTQSYRPIAVLEWVDEVIRGEVASRQAKGRSTKASKEANS